MDRRIALAAALVLLGSAGVASPLVLFEHHDARHAVTFGASPEDPASPNESAVVHYLELPEDTRAKLPAVSPPRPIGDGETVEEAYGGFTATEWARAEAIRSHEYLQLPSDVAGEDGTVRELHAHTYRRTPRYLGATADAVYALVGGALSLVLGISLYRTERLLPIRPRTAAGFALAGVAAVSAYRVVVADSLGDTPYNTDLALAFASGSGSAAVAIGAGAGLVLGTATAWGDRRRAACCLLAGIAALAAIPAVGYGPAGPTAAFGLLGGAAAGLLGFLLGVRW